MPNVSYKNAMMHFADFLRKLPPLVPEEVRAEMFEMFEELKRLTHTPGEVIEELLFFYGGLIWPYAQAFGTLHEVQSKNMSRNLFLQQASPTLRKHFLLFEASGMGFDDLYSGRGLERFEAKHRNEMGSLFSRIKEATEKYTRQAVLAFERKRYLSHVEKAKQRFEKMQSHAARLRTLQEKYHANQKFVDDIEAHLRSYEEGLALFHRGISEMEMEEAHDHFVGRAFERGKFV